MNFTYISLVWDVPGRIHLDFHSLNTKATIDQIEKDFNIASEDTSHPSYDSQAVMNGDYIMDLSVERHVPDIIYHKTMFPSSCVRNLHAQRFLVSENGAFKVVPVRQGLVSQMWRI